MKVLYIGGTGEISHSCVHRSLAFGHEVTVFNRGTSIAALPEGVEHVVGDLRDEHAYDALGSRNFDVVCQFLAYDEASVRRDLACFSGRCDQYAFISSAASYRKPHHEGLVTEAMPLDNPFWAYARSKAACEAVLAEATAAGRLPVTIVRPSHTYRTRLPSTVVDGNHLAWRLLRDKPVIVHDAGASAWTLTHSDDFAAAFCRLLGNPAAIAGTYHITSDEAPTWREIIAAVGDVLGRQADLRSVSSRVLVEHEPAWEGPLLGDKSNAMRFDNSALTGVIGNWSCEVSLQEGLSRVAPQVLERLAAGYQPDPEVDAVIDRLIDQVAEPLAPPLSTGAQDGV